MEVKLYKEIDGLKEFDGILKSYENKTAVITAGDKDIEIEISQAAYIRLFFEI